ncbi:MAG: hypothetical protein PF436_05215 [Prolixibacteraceae bacterium]|jgi:hypothetical protein|nr:hypothetical protein [Prolixibacteraceae bacterium]
MKHILLLFIFAAFVPLILPAQSYERAIGLRTGNSRSIFYEMPANDLSTYRFMLSRRDGGQNLSAMKIFRRYDIDEMPEYLTFYYGYGAHAGFVRWTEEQENGKKRYFLSPIAGLNAIVGVSYDFTDIPVSLTIDARPYFDYGGPYIFKISPSDICIGAILYF